MQSARSHGESFAQAIDNDANGGTFAAMVHERLRCVC
jgi:hypothetical protein